MTKTPEDESEHLPPDDEEEEEKEPEAHDDCAEEPTPVGPPEPQPR